jgi:putative flippase GtrA
MKYEHRYVQKVIAYGCVGIIGTIVHLSTLIILVETFNLDAVLSSSVGFTLTLLISFFLNKVYTFKIKSKKPSHLFLKYVLTSLFGLLLNISLMYVNTTILQLHYLIGHLAVVILIPIINFILNNYWTFK